MTANTAGVFATPAQLQLAEQIHTMHTAADKSIREALTAQMTELGKHSFNQKINKFTEKLGAFVF